MNDVRQHLTDSNSDSEPPDERSIGDTKVSKIWLLGWILYIASLGRAGGLLQAMGVLAFESSILSDLGRGSYKKLAK